MDELFLNFKPVLQIHLKLSFLFCFREKGRWREGEGETDRHRSLPPACTLTKHRTHNLPMHRTTL